VVSTLKLGEKNNHEKKIFWAEASRFILLGLFGGGTLFELAFGVEPKASGEFAHQ
jgi:hypothetical protein